MPTNLPKASELTVAEARRRYQPLQESHDFSIDSLNHIGTEVEGPEPIAMEVQIFNKYYKRHIPLSEISVTVSVLPPITKFQLGAD